MWNPDIYRETLDFVAKKHSGQVVPGKGYSYVVHLANVAQEIMFTCSELEEGESNDLIRIALLHDILEDTETEELELERHFGPEVCAAVRALTKDPSLPKEAKMADSLGRIQEVGRLAAMVKMADRITNLQRPPHTWSKAKAKTYAQQAKSIHRQLAAFHQGLAKRLDFCIKRYQGYLEEMV